ncbi:class I SAM-dependent methyltransferase [Dethiothermospora halolimnae]|uniref:tRNA (mnm(5)s(2)U34)-methyltransferase n=1 Tax=Dethiothermospora halolimnae TaxID=3114390 RepID=UPI003CCBC279
MQARYFIKATEIAKHIIDLKVKEGDVVVDGTVGNGYDTLYLASKVGKCGKVYGFDVQQKAIDNTRDRLVENKLLNRVKLIKDGHEKMFDYIKEKVDLLIFNLGYLPKGDHSIITKPDTTISAIKQGLSLLNNNGILLVVLYYGHEGGEDEKKEVLKFLSNIDQKEFNVLKFNFINQKNKPPILLGVEKKN